MLNIGHLWTGNLRVPEQTSPSPYAGFVTAFKVENNDDCVWVGLEGNTLVIRGSVDKLKILAENIEWFASSEKSNPSGGDHLHIEHYPDHFYLAPSSIPMVLVLRDIE